MRSTILITSVLYRRSTLGTFRKIVYGVVIAAIISILSYSNPTQASAVTSLSFDSKPIVIEDGRFIKYQNTDIAPLGPVNDGINGFRDVTLTAPTGTITVRLNEYGDSGNFISGPIEFTAAPNGGPLLPGGGAPTEVAVASGNAVSISLASE